MALATDLQPDSAPLSGAAEGHLGRGNDRSGHLRTQLPKQPDGSHHY